MYQNRKLHFGSRGGVYIKRKGRKVYIPQQNFGEHDKKICPIFINKTDIKNIQEDVTNCLKNLHHGEIKINENMKKKKLMFLKN